MDEADRLLEASFEPDLRAILTELPAKRQTLLFSATMTKNLVALQKAVLHDAYHFQVSAINCMPWSFPNGHGYDLQDATFCYNKHKLALLRVCTVSQKLQHAVIIQLSASLLCTLHTLCTVKLGYSFQGAHHCTSAQHSLLLTSVFGCAGI